MMDLEALKNIPKGKRISVYLDAYIYDDLKSRADKAGRKIGKELVLRIEDHLDMKPTLSVSDIDDRYESE